MRRISVVILSLLMIASMLLSACQPAPTPVAEQPKEEKPAEQPAQAEQPKEEQPAAAKPGIEDGVLTIAWIPKALNNPVFETGRVGAELKAKELSEQGKIKVEILYTAPTKSDIAEQAAVMEGVIAKGVDAIGVSCNEPEGCVDPINKAVEAGIPVMTWDSDSPNSKRFTYLGVDNKEGGKAAAELLKMALPNGGKVALLTGVPGAANLEARIAGFKEGVEGSNIEIVDTVACNDDIQKGVQVVEETMTKYPDLNGWFFVGLWPIFAGEGAMPKWEEATKKGMKSVAFDTLPVELDWVKKGMLYGLVGQKYFGWGYDTVQMIYDKIVNGKEFEPFTNSGMDIVTICNVDEMAKAWESNDFTKPLSDWKCDKLAGAAPAAEAGPVVKAEKGKTLNMVLLPKFMGNMVFEQAYQGAQEAHAELENKGKLDFLGPTADNSVAGQIEIVTSATTQKVNAIMISNNAGDQIAEPAKKAREAGVTVVTWDSPIPSAEGEQVFVAQVDFNETGKVMADMALSIMGEEGGKFAVLSASPDAANQNAWIAALKEALKDPKYAKLELVDIVYGNDQSEDSYNQALALVDKYPDLKVIMAPTTIGINAAAKAMQDEGLCDKVKVSGLGLPSEMVEFTRNGCAPEFALWSFKDLGYLTYYVTYLIASGALKGEAGETFEAGRMGTYTIEKDPTREKGLRVLMGPFSVYNKDNIEAEVQ